MPKVIAWQCPHTKKLFALEDEAKYKAHLKKIARARAQDRKIKKATEVWDEFVCTMQKSVTSFTELEAFVQANWKTIAARAAATGWESSRRKWLKTDCKISLLEMHRSESCCNSHCAPKGKPTNWGGKPDLPRGYPGWLGRINIRIKPDAPGFMSDIFKCLGIHTGSGGGGTGSDGYTCLSYAVTIFDDDFVGLADAYQKQRTWKLLGGNIKKEVV